MIHRNCTLSHEFVCATDDTAGLDADIRTVPVERNLIPLGNAYPKLAVFRPDAADIFGERICLIDLDVVITGSINEIVNRQEPFVIWQDVLAKSQPKRFKYNSSLILMNAGARSQVWRTFDRNSSPRLVRHRCGSDQAWISHMLDGEPTWSSDDGVFSWRFDKPLANARMIFFHGREKPWMLPNHSIIKQHWH